MIMRYDHALCSCRGPAGIMKEIAGIMKETKEQICGDGGRKTGDASLSPQKKRQRSVPFRIGSTINVPLLPFSVYGPETRLRERIEGKSR